MDLLFVNESNICSIETGDTKITGSKTAVVAKPVTDSDKVDRVETAEKGDDVASAA